MIISRTPFRVSFVGGGTDLEAFCSREPGAVLSTTINKYIYVTVRRQVAIASHRFRISWSKLEFVDSVDEIEHPIIREALKLLEIDFPLEITTFADIPSQTGLGSSSAFAVGLLNALLALKGQRVTKYRLAEMAAEIEINRLGRKIGRQDHFAAAYGNFNIFRFFKDSSVEVQPVYFTPLRAKEINERLLMFYTEMQRDAWKILERQSSGTVDKFPTLCKMRDLVEPLEQVMLGNAPLDNFGELLHQNWLMKREITEQISNPRIDEYYERARAAGAIGGKLLGAGGGGFLLLYVDPSRRREVMNALKELFCMPFVFERSGSRITYYDNSGVGPEAIEHDVWIDYVNRESGDNKDSTVRKN